MASNAINKQSKGAAVASRVLVDEELWFGNTNVKAAELAAAQSMAATAGSVVGAKPFPESARRLAELSSQEDSPVGEIVQVLEQDPALSAKLLRVVNSVGFGLRQRCTSIRHAVTLVGSKKLHQIATTAAVLDLFDAESGPAVAVLEHSAVVGAFCRYLGSHQGLPSEELFTAGVLHDIGKLMLLDTFGDRYHAIFDAAQDHPDNVFGLERKEFGFDHGILAAHVLKTWNIPDPLPKIVAWHHEPTRAYESSPLHASLVLTVRLADILAHAMSSRATRAELGDIVQHEAASYLDISEAQLGAMWEELTALRERTLQQRRSDTDDTESPGDASATRVRASQGPGAPVETPKQFPCARCGSPSFGNACPACKGYACPNHPIGEAGWCSVCNAEYPSYVQSAGFPITATHSSIGALIVSVTGGMLGWVSGGTESILRGIVAGICIAAFGLAAVVLAKRSYIRARFLRTRPNREVKG